MNEKITIEKAEYERLLRIEKIAKELVNNCIEMDYDTRLPVSISKNIEDIGCEIGINVYLITPLC